MKIAEKDFKHNLLLLAVPIILQNLFSSMVGAADTFMLNYIGQKAVSSVALANQPQFILSLFYAGLTAGTGIMMAQYIGAKDMNTVSALFRLALKLTLGISFFFTLITISVPHIVMRAFTPDAALIETGSRYLRITGISYLLSAFSQVYLVTLKAFRQAKKSSVISIITLSVNVILNMVLIFGVFHLGVVGAALATTISRGIELLICLTDFLRKKQISLKKKPLFSIRKDYVKITFPIMLQGLVWGGAMTVFSAIMGRMGQDAVAANSIASAIQNMATVASFGLAEAGAILLGNDLGKGNLSASKRNASVLLKTAVLSGIVCCIIMLLSENIIVNTLNMTETAVSYFHIMYKLLSVNVIFAAVTYTLLCGIFAAGGDTSYGLILDSIVMWGYCVLCGSIAAFIFRLNPIWVFIILNMDELIKTPIVLFRYKQNKWIQTITKGGTI